MQIFEFLLAFGLSTLDNVHDRLRCIQESNALLIFERLIKTQWSYFVFVNARIRGTRLSDFLRAISKGHDVDRFDGTTNFQPIIERMYGRYSQCFGKLEESLRLQIWSLKSLKS